MAGPWEQPWQPGRELQECEAKVCEPGGSGLLLPLFGDGEQDWPDGVRAPLYLLGLLWMFMGVAVVSDVFMASIYVITSKKKTVSRVSGRDEVTRNMTVKVWNDTVANLTLMALGSSAPEILLSVIDLFGKEMKSGDLGPSTIVGSAAFNLLCICAVCVVAIPDGEVRRIKDLNVFAVTATFSVFAYLWLFFCVSVNTVDVVDIGEGVVTILFFPLLVTLAYMADRGMFSSGGATHTCSMVLDEDTTKEELAEMERQVLMDSDRALNAEELMQEMNARFGPKNNRAAYRMAAVRGLSGANRHHVVRKASKERLDSTIITTNKVQDASNSCGHDANDMMRRAQNTVEFVSSTYSVMENVGQVHLLVRRCGNSKKNVTVDYRTKNGTAIAGEDFLHTEGVLEFCEGVTEQEILVEVVDDKNLEGEEEFYCELSNPTCEDEKCHAELGQKTITTVRIVDDEQPGTLHFSEEAKFIEQGSVDKTLAVEVERKDGCHGVVAVSYRTEDGQAIAGWDYEPAEGVLEFQDGQAEASITITIKPGTGRYEKSDVFRVIMSNPTNGAKLDQFADGGPESNICTVTIGAEKRTQDRIDRMFSLLHVNMDKAKIGSANWRSQFEDALSVQGEEEGVPPTTLDYVMHAVTVFWKVLFAFIPPTDYCGGWLCFVCALLMIGGCTAIIGDLAELFGCVLGIPDSITAITFVALGTSLPDLFASKTAAAEDPYADASIGNVTGSNSVNVFLGLGLPWVIGSIYWAAAGWSPVEFTQYADVALEYPDGGKFVVVGGNLGFSLIIFSICALVCIAVLMVRRVLVGGELGGPSPMKYISAAFMASLWFIYIGLSTWYALDNRGPCD